MTLKLNYYWDFDFQGQFEVDVPIDNRPYLAIAGGLLHGDIYGKLAELFLSEGGVELSKKSHFRNRDKGFTRNKALRGNDLKVIRVLDRKTKKTMISIPDVVDYRNDLIIDLKTYYLKQPPDKGGIFVASEGIYEPDSLGETMTFDPETPEGYENAWDELKSMIEIKLTNKYIHQFERYNLAYIQATGRIPTINIYVVLYALTQTYEHDNGNTGMRRR